MELEFSQIQVQLRILKEKDRKEEDEEWMDMVEIEEDEWGRERGGEGEERDKFLRRKRGRMTIKCGIWYVLMYFEI
jgi:hypothetical protein